ADATGTDTGTFWHDGTNFRADFANTDNWAISDIGAVVISNPPNNLTLRPRGNGNIAVRNADAGPVRIDIDPQVSDNTSNAQVAIGRTTNTSGTSGLLVFRGNNSTTTAIRLVTSGSSAPGGHLYLQRAPSPLPNISGMGQIWIRDSDMALMYTDDQGNDHQIAFV